MSFQAIANVGCFSSRGCTANNIQQKTILFLMMMILTLKKLSNTTL